MLSFGLTLIGRGSAAAGSCFAAGVGKSALGRELQHGGQSEADQVTLAPYNPDPCAPRGYVTPASPLPSAAEVTSPVTARIVPSKYYCSSGSLAIPCPGNIPPGFHRLDMTRGPAQVLAKSPSPRA
jgi:hypothetical protein